MHRFLRTHKHTHTQLYSLNDFVRFWTIKKEKKICSIYSCFMIFFSSSHIIGNNEMCLFGPNKVLNESKRTNDRKKINIRFMCFSVSLLCFHSLTLTLSLSLSYCSRNFCANDWLIWSEFCVLDWIWFDGSLLVVLFSHLMCHSLWTRARAGLSICLCK